ncbi:MULTISPECIES: 3-deoxy-D-manno-octulosonic acid transferase [Proteiniphilum]|jgi:3-deoxy-D-manno-octulosonic-acid transferase|uniref:3-deoxy-D-manno-octulosonic acid transferase n=1 Tax=Proteiniphilum TaxID=294702 RepID=UPI001EEA7593|nr:MULTISPECIES: glycosyltransferase N-terminal domain-containing protein [Proteiniphilum]MDD4778770.1 glycosyltransferase N-terminal domain-containing protein [Fermentimonas sp.]ULB35811.1 3-deoxy-D-manno-octulosonic acid transferase [Proteiniphilum propionicum]
MYNIGIFFMAFFIRLAALFKKKARLMVSGQKATFSKLKEKIDRESRYIWLHAASLGEFEQARPLIEAITKEHPEYKILLTFFSPSGYEVRKDYPLADIVCYLPFDTKKNVRRFLDLANPFIAIFIKYEFWYNYIHESFLRKIPVYLASAVFRPGQPFFKNRLTRYGKMLRFYSHFFVQDELSAKLLKGKGIENVTLAGDTRIDRVIEVRNNAKELPVVEKFADKKSIVIVAGSSWAPDEDLLIDYFNTHSGLKLIIAPHEIDEPRLREIEKKLKRAHLRYSNATEENITQCECLIIDCFGLLSSIYRYGQIAYIGGGFGEGIHNLPEAAVYGIPVIFGPRYSKFIEAHGLITNGGGFSISNKTEFNKKMDEMALDSSSRINAGVKAKEYIFGNAGATREIMKLISL